jgi:hypothetical protein
VALLWGCIGNRMPGIQATPRPCTSDADCAHGQMCLVGMCSRPGTVPLGGDCLTTRDCVTGLYCNRSTGACAVGGTGEDGAACASDAQCLPPLYCGHSGFFGACTSSGTTDLGGPCATTKDCLAGLYCGQGSTCQPYAQAFPPFAGVKCAADEGPFRVYFEVPRGAPPPPPGSPAPRTRPQTSTGSPFRTTSASRRAPSTFPTSRSQVRRPSASTS